MKFINRSKPYAISLKSMMVIAIALIAIIVGASAPLMAQTAAITGRITDVTSAILPNTTVAITETATGATRVVKTNSDGYFTVPALLPGEYSVEASHAGFSTARRSNVRLEVSQVLRLDFQMSVGETTEDVVVEAGAVELDTETHTVGQVVTGQEVTDLPLLGRDAYALGNLTPGVRNSAGMNSLPVDIVSTSFISINGTPANLNEFLLDGAPNSSPFANQPIIYPIADLVQEFKVQTSGYSAEYGRTSGGIYNVETKHGTNNIHFSAYEFYRNDTLQANDWFAKSQGIAGPALTFNQFGGVAGGPVIVPHIYDGRGKTFFFVGAEYVRFDQGNTYTAVVPDPTFLGGDFSKDVNTKGQAITLYNPYTTRKVGNSYTRDPYTGNQIPVNPVSAAIAKYFPKPNINVPLGSGQSNFINVTANSINENAYSFRVDHNFSGVTHIFGRYSRNLTTYVRPSPYGNSNLGSPGYGPQTFKRQNAILGYDHVFSPSTVMALSTAYSRLDNNRLPVSNGFDISTLGFPNSLGPQIGAPAAFPVITITGYSVSGSIANSTGGYALGETGLLLLTSNYVTFTGKVTKTIKSHTLDIGGDFRVIQGDTGQASDNSTNFGFTTQFTQQNPNVASTTQGDALASFLLGTPNTGSVAPAPQLTMETKYAGAFLEDTWKMFPKLTLNLGVRYEFETPRTERHNQLANFDLNAPVPLVTPGYSFHGTLSFVGVNGQSRYQNDPEYTHISPRVGLAWQVMPGTVFRAGFGQYYANLWGDGSNASIFGISGFTATTNMVTSNDGGLTPANTLSNPYPTGLNPVTGSSLGGATLLGQSISIWDRHHPTPYALQYNADIQQQFAHAWLLDIGYVGTHTVHYPVNLQLDQLPDQYLALGTSLLDPVTNPFYGKITTGTLATTTVPRNRLLVPYPQFTGITSQNADIGSAYYNALQTTLERRFAKGYSVLVAYTWSKMLDIGGQSFGGESLSGAGIQDYYNLKAEKSISALDQTNRLVFQTIYALPFFREQHGFMGHTFGGWQASMLGTFFSGSPLGIGSSANTTNSLGGGQRPNWNGMNPSLTKRTVSQWFNTTDFSAAPAYTFGNSPRTFSFLRSDWGRNVDASLQKNIHVVSHLSVQLRGDAFNLTNTPVFQPPNTTLGSKQFGFVTAQQNTPRVIQVGVKILY
jgi:hypothetical protein